jgi:hypothetical protein
VKELMMFKLATIAFGAALAIAPGLIYAQTAPGDQMGNQTSGAVHNGSMGAGVTSNNAPGTAGNMAGESDENLGPGAGYYNPGAAAQANSANAGIATPKRAMPRTADNWSGLLLIGSLLSGAGVMLRRLCKA